MSIRLITAFVLSFLFTTAFGKFYIKWLHDQKVEQVTKRIGPRWHESKTGTPTMGGVMFIAAVALVCLTVGFQGMLAGDWKHIFAFLFAGVFGFIGFLDDWEKIKNKRNLGLTAKAKFTMQLLAALLFVFLMRKAGTVGDELYIPFVNKSVYIPAWLFYILSSFIIVGTVNSVNITDGIDGLAAGTSIPVFLFFVAVTYLWGERYLQLGIFSSGILGGLVGFLIYNYNPAKVFMGDTGSLFLGGALAALAFFFDIPLILVTLGVIFIIETLSDIIQIVYYKISHGKRVFKMAPFHHHLEMGGWTGKKWSEKELFVFFSSISLIFSIISFVGIYGRFQ